MALLEEPLIKFCKGNVPWINRVFYFLHSFPSVYGSIFINMLYFLLYISAFNSAAFSLSLSFYFFSPVS